MIPCLKSLPRKRVRPTHIQRCSKSIRTRRASCENTVCHAPSVFPCLTSCLVAHACIHDVAVRAGRFLEEIRNDPFTAEEFYARATNAEEQEMKQRTMLQQRELAHLAGIAGDLPDDLLSPVAPAKAAGSSAVCVFSPFFRLPFSRQAFCFSQLPRLPNGYRLTKRALRLRRGGAPSRQTLWVPSSSFLPVSPRSLATGSRARPWSIWFRLSLTRFYFVHRSQEEAMSLKVSDILPFLSLHPLFADGISGMFAVLEKQTKLLLLSEFLCCPFSHRHIASS